jgi:hypothetical protein
VAYSVQEVPIEFVNRAWSDVEKFITTSVEYADGEFTLDEVKARLVQGSWSLVVAVDESNTVRGVATVAYYNRTDHRVAFVTNFGGKFVSNPEVFSQFASILVSKGATCMEGAVRDSMLRLWARLGARKKSTNIQIIL